MYPGPPTPYYLHQSRIRESYTTGGAVDVYIPHNHHKHDITNPNFDTLYQYDANSLYASVMKEVPMPVGKPIAFEGDIRSVDPDAFGFFYCEIVAPDNLQHPSEKLKLKTESEQ